MPMESLAFKKEADSNDAEIETATIEDLKNEVSEMLGPDASEFETARWGKRAAALLDESSDKDLKKIMETLRWEFDEEKRKKGQTWQGK